MTYKQLYDQILRKGSFLCVGLDTDMEKIPACIKQAVSDNKLPEEEAMFLFNKATIDATVQYAVAYKINTAFYEAEGWNGIRQMEKTVSYLKENYPDVFVIADAKRGDIGNTAKQYAKAFFEKMDCDAVTLSPYMGGDAIMPFLKYEGKWAIILALTSNVTAEDFETLETRPHSLEIDDESQNHVPLYERVLRQAERWGSKENIMFVVGATRPDQLYRIRLLSPDSFFLVPGVGAQGGTVEEVATAGMNSHCGLLVNSSRGILYADSSVNFASAASEKARELVAQMRLHLNQTKR